MKTSFSILFRRPQLAAVAVISRPSWAKRSCGASSRANDRFRRIGYAPREDSSGRRAAGRHLRHPAADPHSW